MYALVRQNLTESFYIKFDINTQTCITLTNVEFIIFYII